MDKVVYAVYLGLITTTLAVIARVLWGKITQRPVKLRAPFVWMIFLSGLAAAYFHVAERQPRALGVERTKFASEPNAPIKIAAVWPDDQSGFFAGAQRAAQEINASELSFRSKAGKLVKFSVEIANFPYDEKNKATIAREVIKDTHVLGVVGHADAVSAIQGSATYHISQLVHFVPSVQDTTLTSIPFDGTFQLVADDHHIIDAIADFIVANGYDNIAIVAERDEYAHQLYIYLQNELSVNVLGDDTGGNQRFAGQVVSPTTQYLTHEDSAVANDEIITTLSEQMFDLVLILDDDPSIIDFLSEFMRRRLDLPVMVLPHTASFYSEFAASVFEGIDDAQKKLIYVVDLNDALIRVDPMLGSFREAFINNYAYDSVMLMAEMWKRAGTLSPLEASSKLRALPDWVFAGQLVDFSSHGKLVDPKVDIRLLDDIFSHKISVTNN